MTGPPASRVPRLPPWAGALAAVALVGAAAAVGARAWTERQEEQATERWRALLSAMADDRRDAVEAWVRERLGHARTVAGYPTAEYLAAGRSAPPYPFPPEEGARRHLTELLRSSSELLGYEGSWLVGPGPGAPALAGSAAEPPDRPLLERVRLRNEAEIDFLQQGGRALAVVAAPVRPRDRPGGGPIGVVALVADAGPTLFPLLGREPLPTRTEESLLVRREGKDVVFLSPLRHGPPGLRLPATTTGLAAAAAFDGREGFGTFRDYRGAVVLAAVRHVRGAGCGLVVKVDRDEAVAAARSGARQTLAAIAGVLLALLGTGFGVWNRHAAAARVALARSEARFGLVLEHAADAILFVRRNGTIAKANRRAEELYGRSRRELESLRIHDLYPADRRPSVEERMAAVRRRSTHVFETEHVARDGTVVPVEVSSRWLEEEGFFFSIVRDVRERKAVTAALAESKAFLQTLVDSASAAIFTLLPDGRVGDVWNPAAERVFGWPREEVVGRPAPIVPPEREEEARALRRLVVEKGAVTNVDVTRVRRDGSPIELSLAASPLRGPDGGVAAILAVAIDVTERKRAEQAVRRLSAAVEQSPVAIVITDTAGTIEYVNPAFCRHTGYAREEAIGQNPRILKSGHHPPEFYAEIYATIASGREWRGEIRNRKKDGELFWEYASISPITGEDGRLRHYLAVKEDVTDRKRAEEALRRAQAELLQSQKLEAVGRLAGGVAHDFNNLLGVVIGHGEMAQRSEPPGSPLRGRLEAILDAAHRAAELTRQLLAFSRRQVLQPRVLDLNAEVADMEKMLRRLIGEDVALVTRLDPGLGRVRADPGQVGQVLMNLAVNARDAMPQGGVLTIETSNVQVDRSLADEHAPLRPGRYVRLVVADDGAGLDPAAREHLFEPFFTTKPDGSGLGLSTVYGIVAQSGGLVWADPGKERGTTFTVLLPRWEGLLEERPLAGPQPPGGSETILVVEDEDELRALVCEVLEDAGYRVLQASNGRSALSLVDSWAEPIDLLLTDVVMPGMSGRELAEALRARREGIRALLMSGYPHEAIDRAGGLGGCTLLAKPFSRGALLQQVREALQAPRG